MNDATLELPFDQYQRYRLVADILDGVRARGERLSVLDVGGRTALLRQFLPEDEVHLVDVEASEEQGLVLGDGSRLPFADGAVDALVTFDTLEHVPPARREAFVAECARVARRWVVIAGPYAAPRVEEAESRLEDFIHEKLGEEHRYLAEHKANGLPDRDVTEAGLRAAGAEVVSIGHANLERWLALMCLSLYLDRDAPLRGIAKEYFRFYNAALYASDHAAPVYRHAVVAAFEGATLPDPAHLLAPPVAPAGALDLSLGLFEELARFDVQRDAIAPEWARLEEVNQGLALDLEGHKRTLLALREVQDEQKKVIDELQGRCVELVSNEEELELELEREREESAEVAATLKQDLGEHKKAIVELEADLDEHRRTVARLEEEAERERKEQEQVLHELNQELAGHKEVVTELQAERGRLEARLLEEGGLRADAEAAHAIMKQDLDGHRALVEALREEIVGVESVLEREAQQHEAHAAALESEVRSREEALAAGAERERSAEESIRMIRSEFEAQNERLREAFEALAAERAVIHELRLQLRQRWGNLKRAFGPKPEFGPD